MSNSPDAFLVKQTFGKPGRSGNRTRADERGTRPCWETTRSGGSEVEVEGDADQCWSHSQTSNGEPLLEDMLDSVFGDPVDGLQELGGLVDVLECRSDSLVDFMASDGTAASVSLHLQNKREKNRLASAKCRKKKREYIQMLEAKCESLEELNAALILEMQALSSTVLKNTSTAQNRRVNKTSASEACMNGIAASPMQGKKRSNKI